jgi:two-component system chemotaxis sensor kinase CheA
MVLLPFNLYWGNLGMGVRQNLEQQFDFEIVDEFIEHFEMMLDVMENLIISLDKTDFYERNVDELFRIFHNIKSATGFLKLDSIHRFSGLVEDTLDQLRDREGPANDEVISWLLDAHDMFQLWRLNIINDTELDKLKYSLLTIPDIDKVEK